MADDLQRRLQRNRAALASQTFAPDELDYAVLDRHVPFLQQLDHVGSSAISVFDLCQMRHVYASPNYLARLGLDADEAAGTDGLEAQMHPDDLGQALDAGYYFWNHALATPPGERRHLKLVQDFRLRRPATGWLRVCEQHVLLESDARGNVWLALSILDVTPDQDVEAPFRSCLVDLRTSEVYVFPAPETAEGPLSEREKQVLSLVASGMPSKQIADRLYLSVHTVNTHRQNILRKTGTPNAANAVRYATERGLL